MVEKTAYKDNLEKLRLLRVREKLRKRRPTFRRVESWRYKRVGQRWRRPRGIDSKAREKKKGWPKLPTIGYRSPKEIRNKTPTGMEEILIYSVADLSLIDPNTQVARIGSKVGLRKREKIIMEAELQNIHILNPITAKVKVDLSDLEEELELDEELLEDISIEDLELDKDKQGEEE
ncbi:MAG: 50S ribosomal protein L32e [Candidatus Hodarchaeales archaeon]